MRNLSILITQARRATENLEFSDSVGITDNEFIQYANDAQDELEAQISKANADVNIEKTYIDCVQGQEDYLLPDDTLLHTKLAHVLWSPNGSESQFRALQQGRPSEIISTYTGSPSFYVRLGQTVKVIPAPQASSSKLKIYYQQKLPRLEVQAGKVGAVTTSGNTITALTLDSGFSAYDKDTLLEEGFVTICDASGNVKMKAIPITDIDDTTLDVTVDPSFVFEDGETIAVGDFVLRGKRSTSHCSLPDICERYLLAYMQWRILKRDSSNDAIEQKDEMQMMLASIVDAYNEPDYAVDGIPIIDTQYLDLEGRL